MTTTAPHGVSTDDAVARASAYGSQKAPRNGARCNRDADPRGTRRRTALARELRSFAGSAGATGSEGTRGYTSWPGEKRGLRSAVNSQALGFLEGDTISWFWIGSHANYETLIS